MKWRKWAAHGTKRGTAPVYRDVDVLEAPSVDQRSGVSADLYFRRAWQSMRRGDEGEAARGFELALRVEGGPRRADLLFWAARAHEASGNAERAGRRLHELIHDYPNAWHAAEAKAILARLQRMPRSTPKTCQEVDGPGNHQCRP